MNKDIIMGIGILIVVVGLLVLSLMSMMEVEETASFIENDTSTSGLIYLTKTSQGEVSVDLTPNKFDKGLFYVSMSVNTHTINDLNRYDVKKNVELHYKGKTYKPVSALSLQGHHTNGELVFKIEEQPKEFTIMMYQLHDIKKREFLWR